MARSFIAPITLSAVRAFLARNRMAALARTPVVPEATPGGAVSARSCRSARSLRPVVAGDHLIRPAGTCPEFPARRRKGEAAAGRGARRRDEGAAPRTLSAILVTRLFPTRRARRRQPKARRALAHALTRSMRSPDAPFSLHSAAPARDHVVHEAVTAGAMAFADVVRVVADSAADRANEGPRREDQGLAALVATDATIWLRRPQAVQTAFGMSPRHQRLRASMLVWKLSLPSRASVHPHRILSRCRLEMSLRSPSVTL